MSEKLLIDQVITGDDDAFTRLISPYKNYLLKIIFSFLKNMPDTEEAYQEIIQKIYQGIPSYNGPNIKGWISRIAVNHCIDRKRRKQFTEIELDETLNQPQSSEMGNGGILSPEETLISKETQTELMKIIDSLPVPYREVIKLHYFSELTYKEIGEKLGINERTVETRIYRARKIIGEIWRKHAAL